MNESAPDGISDQYQRALPPNSRHSASALLVAIDSGHEEMAIFLLERCNPPKQTADCSSPAVQHEMHDLAKTLLAHGADPNAKLTKTMPVFSSNLD